MNPSTEALVFMNNLNTSHDPIDKAVCIGMAIAFDMTTPDQAAETVLRLKDQVNGLL